MIFMNLFDKIKAEDVPIVLNADEMKLQEYLRKQKIEVSYDKICKDMQMTHKNITDIIHDISIHWRDNLCSKALFKSMLPGNQKEFETFFQRPDVDLSILCMTMVYDVRKGMKNLDTPSYVFIFDNWKKYRGY